MICRYLSSENFDIFADIRDEIREAQENTNRQRIVKWLSEGVPNPSKEHNAARAKHEDTTGSWLLESKALGDWIRTENSFLWLNGGGKSLTIPQQMDHAS
jgi:hypothetical protein